jgi:hypothetical protein
MKPYVLILLLLLLLPFGEAGSDFYAQNLVPNPSFEAYSNCPSASGQINYVDFWTAPGTSNTPDYYNSCATNIVLSVPYRNLNDYQGDASNGNAFIGIWAFSTLGFVRETVQSQLTQTLSTGGYYYFKMKINLHNYARFAINNVGAIITTNTTIPLYNSNTNSVLYKFNNPIIKDTLNWTVIEAIYKATGGEKYLSIGNFFSDNYTDTISVSSFYPYSYYFIDDVSVEPICTPFWSYRDTAVAIGDSVLIGPAITGLNINWYDASGTFITNAPGIYVKPNSPTFYTATEDFCGSTVTHTIHVGASPLSVKAITSNQRDFTIAPNPTNGVLRISTSLDVTDKIEIKITDVLGKELVKCPPLESLSSYSGRAGGGFFNSTIDITSLANGIYFITLQEGGKTLGVKKVVKQ